VAEISSFQLERTVTFRPHVAVLLNLTPDHLDRYTSYQDYIEAKARIFDFQTPEDFAVLNADDADVSRLAERGEARLFTFSRQGPVVSGAYAQAGEIWTTRKGEALRFMEVEEIRLPGPHNLDNALAATATLLALGALDDEPGRAAATEGLRQFAGLEHRLEFCGEVEGRRFYNDSKATNVASMRQALLSLPRPLTLIAGGRDKHGDFPGIARLAEERIDCVVLIGEAADVIARAWPRIRKDRAKNMDEAVAKAFECTPPGGIVALSPGCASYDMYRDYEERGRRFKTAVESLIRQRSGGGGA
jgi:UDP-N-acetylmuramoylalanine--D-glutamate ligase